jgi:hypothetical protein
MKQAAAIEFALLLGILSGLLAYAALARFCSAETGTILKQLYVKGFGLLITLKYAKYAIGVALEAAKVTPPPMDPTGEAVSRTIGYIERLLAYCFVMDGADNAIAMLITAKGIYRLHELGIGKEVESGDADAERAADQKTYYIMIGTFSSIAYAIVVALAARFLSGLV